MRALRPIHVAYYLLAAAVLLLPLNAIEFPQPPPHGLSWPSLLRVVLGLPVLVFVPGGLIALGLMRKDLLPKGGSDPNTVDVVWWAIAALGLSLLSHVVDVNVLRVLGVPINWTSLGPILAVEAALGVWLLRGRWSGLGFSTLSPGMRRGFVATLALLALFCLWQRPHLVRDGSWYFFSDAVNDGWDATDDRGAITLQWADGAAFEQGATFHRRGRAMGLQVSNAAPSTQRVPVFVALHGPLGYSLELSQGERALGSETIAAGVVGPWSELPVERYWEWGTATALGVAEVPAGGSVTIDLRVLPPDTDAQPDPEDTRLAAWARISSGELTDHLGRRGHHHMHPFQLLNVTENVRWSDEVVGDYVLAGRSPDGKSTLHQPPAWTYLLAPAREVMARHNATASALLLSILCLVSLVGLRAAEDEAAPVPGILTVVLAMSAVQHGRLMVSDGSMNFPDNLYALALLTATVTLIAGRTRLFLLWALLAATLRYPGAVVVGMAGVSLVAMDPSKRRRVINMLVRFGLGIAVFCGVMLVAGIASGGLETWLFALYFETIPEHFGHEGALPVLQRPLEFSRIWMLVGGGVVLLGVPFRGRLSKVTLLTAVLYAPFLAFIDHFSHHYFLPLIALCSTSTVASISLLKDDRARRILSVVAAVLSIVLFVLSVRMGI
jgi:hypothetical protein